MHHKYLRKLYKKHCKLKFQLVEDCIKHVTVGCGLKRCRQQFFGPFVGSTHDSETTIEPFINLLLINAA